MTFYASLRDDLVERSSALAPEADARRRVRRPWPLIGLAVVAVGAGSTLAVAELNKPASQIALETAGGPRGIAEGVEPISIRNGGDAPLWEVAAFEDREGGLGMAASTRFDPRPANMATAAQSVLEEIARSDGATVYGVVQIDDDPRHVVVYGAASPSARGVRVEGRPVRFADETVELTAWANGRPVGPVGEVRIFAADVRLANGLTADRVNGSFIGRAAGDGTVHLTSRGLQRRR